MKDIVVSGVPQPITMTFVVNQRHLDLLQEAAYERQLLLAELATADRHLWRELSAIVLIVASVVLVLALQSAMS